MVQQPRSKPGTSIVLRGGQGYGKSIVGEMMGSLIHSHYLLVDDPRYLIGNFNIHMASLLLLQADEAVWAGDKTAEGRLKSLVTSSAQMIESKGVDPVRLANHLRIIFTSNNDWVVPAGNDERRFAVFDVAPHSAQNHGYFQELADEMDAGGRERLLHDLLAFDLSTVNLREIPKTEALAEQKIHSLDPVGLWWLDRLKAGMPTRGHHEWPDFVPTRVLVDDYVAAADRVGVHRKSSETQFAMRLKKIVPRAHNTRRSVRHDNSGPPERVYGYELPTLRDCRDDFEAYLGQPVPWDRSDE
ncbi:hypothetical protein D3218_10755 [Aureimonas flava]|uniref:PLD phosphodiesterase domain-containing protein n=1 Tax=Aureimonas flava TaxID=2320271 RepID=A0A3A1WIR7_9HYPH|nr:primase-helicase family protein [Aureimonas flava]RIY00874.1 hypothetical protein D3218_10755 [Aureimonas flava]